MRLFTVALLEDNSVRLRRLLEAVARRRGLPAQTHVVELVRPSHVSPHPPKNTWVPPPPPPQIPKNQLASFPAARQRRLGVHLRADADDGAALPDAAADAAGAGGDAPPWGDALRQGVTSWGVTSRSVA